MTSARPYAVSSREYGRSKAHRKTFTTLEAASAYIQSVWAGTDYIDGPDGFHTDHCTWTLTGFVLRDIGHYVIIRDEYEDYREFKFGLKVVDEPAPIVAPPTPTIVEDDGLPF